VSLSKLSEHGFAEARELQPESRSNDWRKYHENDSENESKSDSKGGSKLRSWTHWTKCHTPEYGKDKASNGLLTTETDTKIREEGTISKNGIIEPQFWRDGVREWEDYIRESRDTKIILENEDSERIARSSNSRFEREYMKEQYAKIKALESEVSEKWEDVYCSMITLTNSSNWNGKYAPPIDFLNELLSSWDKARSQIHRIFDSNDEYVYLRILEPHESGYPHQHIAILTDKEIAPRDFQGLVNSHVKNCEHATKDAHKVISKKEQIKRKKRASERGNSPDLGCVSVEKQDDEKAGIGAYVGAYLGKQLNEDDILEADWNEKLFYSLMWLTGKRRFNPSNSANRMIKEHWEDDESVDENENKDKEWEMIGIADSNTAVDDDENIHSINPELVGGIDYRKTSKPLNPTIASRKPPDAMKIPEMLNDAECEKLRKTDNERFLVDI
jgi:hypothetical protein